MYLQSMENFNPEFVQVFNYAPATGAPIGSDMRLLEAVHNHGSIKRSDIEMVKFLYEVKIATVKQISEIFEDMSEKEINDRLHNLIKLRVCNKFMLGDLSPETHVQSDAVVFFTIDSAAIHLLRHETGDEDIENWNAATLYMDATQVFKTFLVTEYFISIKKNMKKNLLTFNTCRIFIGKHKYKIKPKGELIASRNSKNYYFIIDAITDYDINLGDKTKITEKLLRYSTFESEGMWSTYYEDSNPVIIFVADSMETISKVNRIIENLGDFPEYRFTLNELAKNDLKTSLIKYDSNSGQFGRTKTDIFE